MMRIVRPRWAFLGILVVAVAALAPSGSKTNSATGAYITGDPAARHLVKGVWYDSDVTLTQAMVGSTSNDRAKVSDASRLKPGWTIEIISDHGPVPERMIINALVGQCDEAADDDNDGKVNDGCPVFDDGVLHPETGAQCDNAIDDDGDGKVNDGCPVFDDGVPHPETGAACSDYSDNDGDGRVNDGCPAWDAGGGVLPESGAACDNNLDDDWDGYVNDGCPAVGPAETGDQCIDPIDNDGDGKVNDGCPAKPSPEHGADCLNATDDDHDGYVNDGCPEYHLTAESGTQCSNALDDDGDGKVNDGCPEYHLTAESGAQCNNALDDDADGYVNDGCPAWPLGVGPAENPTRDTMVVQRAVNDVRDSHSIGVPIRDHIFKSDIWVKDVPTTQPYGVGAYQLYVSFNPAQLEYVNFKFDFTWLQGTGRSASCSEPVVNNGVLSVSCATLPHPQYGEPGWYPPGAKGSGKIGTVWFRVIDEQALATRLFMLTGSAVYDVSTALITSLVQPGSIKTVACPDANLDGKINGLDGTVIRLNLNDAGQVSGATLAAAIDATQTIIPVSAVGSLAVGKIVAVQNEHMRITAIDSGPPATMTVERGIYTFNPPPTNVPHAINTPIFIAKTDGNYDGIFGYTAPRDTDDNLRIQGLDASSITGALASPPIHCQK